MNGWIVFQLVVDVALFAIIALYILRENRSKAGQPQTKLAPGMSKEDMAQLESLLDELAKLVMRAEKVAVQIVKSVEAAEKALINPGSVQKPETKNAQNETPSTADIKEETETEISGNDERYAKATKLIKKGLPDDKIGAMVGLPSHEVRLIRQMGA